MAQKDPYLPRTDAGKLAFMKNFDDKLSTYAATFGIAAGTITSVTDDTAMFKYMLDMQEKFKTFKQDITAYKNLLSEGPGGGARSCTDYTCFSCTTYTCPYSDFSSYTRTGRTNKGEFELYRKYRRRSRYRR